MTGKDPGVCCEPGLGQLPDIDRPQWELSTQLAQWTHGTWKVSRMLVTCWEVIRDECLLTGGPASGCLTHPSWEGAERGWEMSPWLWATVEASAKWSPP